MASRASSCLEGSAYVIVGTAEVRKVGRSVVDGGFEWQLHLQDDKGNKYYYNFNTKEFEGAPNSLIKKIQNDPQCQRAIKNGATYLGVG